MEKVVVPASSRSSLRSSLSSLRDQSSEIETPATSIAVTPAESLIPDESTCQSYIYKNDKTYPNKGLGKMAKGKRKRTGEDGLIGAGASLARASQKTELEEQAARSNLKRSVRQARIEDSEDDEPLSSTAPRVSSSPVLVRNKKAKTTGATLLPSRVARDIANKAIRDPNAQRFFDSEDSDISEISSDVSLFASDFGSNPIEESGDLSEDADDPAVMTDHDGTPAVRSAAPSAAPIPGVPTPRQRRRVPVNQVANVNRRRRPWRRGTEDRVGQIQCVCAGVLYCTLTFDRRPGSVQSLRSPTRKSRLCGRL